MKAALINEVGRGLGIEDIEISAPVGREVLVDVRASGLCHSDHIVATKGMGFLTPSVWGHEVKDVVDPTGDDHVFDFVGTPPVAERGLAMLAIGGGLYIVGISGPEANVSINMLDAVERQTRVQGIHIGSSSPKHDIPMYADLYLGGQIDLDHIVLTSSQSQVTMNLHAAHSITSSKER